MMEYQYNGKWYFGSPVDEKNQDVVVLKEQVQKILQLDKNLNVDDNQQQQQHPQPITVKKELDIQTNVEQQKEKQGEQNIQQVNQDDVTLNK